MAAAIAISLAANSCTGPAPLATSSQVNASPSPSISSASAAAAAPHSHSYSYCSLRMQLSSPSSLTLTEESNGKGNLILSSPFFCHPRHHLQRSNASSILLPPPVHAGKVIRTIQAVKVETSKVDEEIPNSATVDFIGHEIRDPVGRKNKLLLRVDTIAEGEMKKAKNGLRGMRRTKLVCTIGPSSCSLEQLEAMAESGMNIARLNMCHGTKEWHSMVIGRIRKLNKEKGFSVAVMMDTEGSEIHMGDLWGSSESVKTEDGDVWIFTVRNSDQPAGLNTIQVNYGGFAEDVRVGDELVVDGGMVRFEVIDKLGPDVHCRCTDPGLLLPRANLTFWRDGHLLREGSAMLPTLSSKDAVQKGWVVDDMEKMRVRVDQCIESIARTMVNLYHCVSRLIPDLYQKEFSHDWIDIDFGIRESVDFIAVSFVKAPDVIMHLQSYVSARSPNRKISIIAKIESYESLECLEDIIVVSDGVMVGRGDLSAQIPIEQVPSVQEKVVYLCRQLNKPVMVASQLLESMMEYPTPTRAEVADVSEMVQQHVDALMLSGESAMGRFPVKSLDVLRIVSLRMEEKCRVDKTHDLINLQQLAVSLPDKISEEICNAAAVMANELNATAIFVYTKQGHMATLLSRNRAQCPIFAFTDSEDVRIHLNLLWGVTPFGMSITQDMEHNLEITFSLLKARDIIKEGDLIIVVSDLAPSNDTKMVQSIQVRRII